MIHVTIPRSRYIFSERGVNINMKEGSEVTFFDWLLWFFIVVPIVFLWVFALFDIFARVDLTGGQKALWVLLIFIIPFFGTLIYLVARPQVPRHPPTT